MTSRTTRSSRQYEVHEQDTVQRPAKKRRMGKENATSSQLSKSTINSTKTQWTTYRVREIPDNYDEESFRKALLISLQLEEPTTLTIHSFASNRLQQRIATITFSNTPTRLCSAMADTRSQTTEWILNIAHSSSTQTDTICIDTHFKGFTPLSPIVNDEEHSIDCIAIHGWGSHPLGGFKAHDDTYVWLRDSLAKDVPQLRIYIYGYECDITADDSISGVDDYADSLRRLLRDMRGQDKNEPPVPLVFIAHSLGGMVLKQAITMMKESSDSNDKRNINSIYGILFFGVPSQGMETEALAAMVGDKPQRYDLSLLNEQVGQRLRSRQHAEFCKAFDFKDSKIVQFFETKMTPTVAEDPATKKWARTGPKKLLVKPASATSGRQWDMSEESRVSIDADHSDMVKFSRFDQDGYFKTRDELRKFAQNAMLVIEERLERIRIDKLSLHQHRSKVVSIVDRTTNQKDLAYLRSLAFPEMNYRRQDMQQRAHKNTCGWISSHSSYTAWLKEGSGILWVKGKPGSGKSTVMEFLLRHFKKQPSFQNSIQLSFFFHGRGEILQKSRLGMYRSLLHQLLLGAPDASAEFHHAFQERFSSQGEPGKDWDWHTNELREFFMAAIDLVASTQPVNIIIDALDEASNSPEGQGTSQQIVSDFHNLNDVLHRKKLRSTICFSSRPFPIVATNQGREICVEKENHADISAYVSNELRERLSISEAEKQYVTVLQDTIIENSKGVFQWAVLVVDLVVENHNNGESPEKIMQMLAEVPEELSTVYKHILSKVVNKRNYQQTLRLMRCVCLAQRPLTVIELCFAMSVPDTEMCDTEFCLAKIELPTPEVMMRRIVSLTGGLVETKNHWQGQIIQVIHQSVTDFLLRDGGLQFLDKASTEDSIGQGHHQLSLICANYMRMTEVRNSNNLDPTSVKAQLPFIYYAARSWFFHAERAEAQSVPQDYLLRYSHNCPNMLKQWIRLYSIVNNRYRPGWRPVEHSTMLHIASSVNLLSVVEGLLPTCLDLEVMDGSGNRALHYASRWGHIKVVKALIDAGALVEVENKQMCTPLERAAANGHEEIVGVLLASGADVNKETGDTGNALCVAAAKGSRAIVQALLRHGAKINSQGGDLGNALQAAAYFGHQAVVQLLLDNKAEVNAQGGYYGNALQAAATRGDLAVVQLLLDNKAEVNAQGGRYRNALQAAASNGHQAVVQLFLDNKAEVNAQGGHYRNALQAAANFGHLAVVQLLLDNNAKVTNTALEAASGNSAIIQLLKTKAEVQI